MTTTLKRAFEKPAARPTKEPAAVAGWRLEELEFLAALQEGLAAANRGEVIALEGAWKTMPATICEPKKG